MNCKQTGQMRDAVDKAKSIVSNTLVWDNHGCMPV